MAPADRGTPWYVDGLRFECSRCGDCCRGPGGYVWVTWPEIGRLAHHLDLSLEEFAQRYVRRVGERLALTDASNGDCVFWADGCTVYQARPTQCRTFPFWPRNVSTLQAWERTVTSCPGSGEGRLYPLGEITELSEGHGETEAPALAPDDPSSTR